MQLESAELFSYNKSKIDHDNLVCDPDICWFCELDRKYLKVLSETQHDKKEDLSKQGLTENRSPSQAREDYYKAV